MIRGALAPLLACSLIAGAATAPALAAPAPTTPIDHFVVLMQENHSFDNYFGTYPGADGIPRDTCMPIEPTRSRRSGCIEPFHLGNRTVHDTPVDNTTRVARRQYNGGRMNGFVSAFRAEAGTLEPAVMGYYDRRELPFSWNVADEYVLFDRFFASSDAGTLSNHMFWTAASSGALEDGAVPESGFRGLPTIFDRLEQRGIPWKFYVENYDPDITYSSRPSGERRTQLLRVPLLGYPRFVDHPGRFGKIVDLSEYYRDLERGTLPAVAYIAPSGSSEHPPGSVEAGQKLVRTLIGALMRSPDWKSSAFMWTYDGSGGWYDHVRPPKVDGDGFGFRVPALLVSPFARRGAVDSTPLDFSAIPRFIERNWGLRPLARRDARARSIVRELDFERPPRPPVLISAKPRRAAVATDARPAVIYSIYGLALVATALTIALAVVHSRRIRVPR